MPGIVRAVLITTALAFVPALAQQDVQEPQGPRLDASRVGLPLLSSDGEKIGQITAVEIYNGQVVLIGEIDRPLGLGSDTVSVPAGMFKEEADHIQLSMPAESIRDSIAQSGARGSAGRPLPLSRP
jgi:hypothetical protein